MKNKNDLPFNVTAYIDGEYLKKIGIEEGLGEVINQIKEQTIVEFKRKKFKFNNKKSYDIKLRIKEYDSVGDFEIIKEVGIKEIKR